MAGWNTHGKRRQDAVEAGTHDLYERGLVVTG
jgi:hypothetical protein